MQIKKENNLKILFCLKNSVNLKEMFMTWIQDPDPHQNKIDPEHRLRLSHSLKCWDISTKLNFFPHKVYSGHIGLDTLNSRFFLISKILLKKMSSEPSVEMFLQYFSFFNNRRGLAIQTEMVLNYSRCWTSLR